MECLLERPQLNQKKGIIICLRPPFHLMNIDTVTAILRLDDLACCNELYVFAFELYTACL